MSDTDSSLTDEELAAMEARLDGTTPQQARCIIAALRASRAEVERLQGVGSTFVEHTDDQLDEALSTAPEYVANMAEAESEIASGARGASVGEAFGGSKDQPG